MKIRTKLMFMTLIPALLIILTYYFSITFSVNKLVSNMILKSSDDLVKSRAGEIEGKVSEYLSYLRQYSQIIGEETNGDLSAIYPLLVTMQRFQSNNISRIAFANLDGNFIDSNNNQGNIASTNYFREIINNGKKTQVSSFINNPETKEKYVTINRVVTNSSGETIGIISAILFTTQFENWAEKVEYVKDGLISLVDKNSVIIGHKLPKYHGFKIQDSERLLGSTGLNEKTFLTTNHGIEKAIHHKGSDKKYYISFSEPVSNADGWVVASSIPISLLDSAGKEIRNTTILITIFFIILIPFITGILSKKIVAPLKRVSNALTSFAADTTTDLTQEINIYPKSQTKGDELFTLVVAYNKVIENIRSLIEKVVYSNKEVFSHSKLVAENSDNVLLAMNNQQASVESVATSMSQVVVTMQNISRHAQDSSNSVDLATSQVQDIESRINSAVSIMAEDKASLIEAVKNVNELQRSGEKIGEIMDVINSIAEQTNLLALNAAIEAARAGDAGRGFAVVADEVRTLAARTHDSTNEISKTIEDLQFTIANTSASIENSNLHAQKVVEEINETKSSIVITREKILEMQDLVTQIAHTTESETQTISYLDESVDEIANLNLNSKEIARNLTTYSNELLQVVSELNKVIMRFKI